MKSAKLSPVCTGRITTINYVLKEKSYQYELLRPPIFFNLNTLQKQGKLAKITSAFKHKSHWKFSPPVNLSPSFSNNMPAHKYIHTNIILKNMLE